MRTDGEAPVVCAGANKHNSLYRTLTAAGVAPRPGYELVLVAASGPGGVSPLYHRTRKRFSYLPGEAKSRKNKVAIPATTDQGTVGILRMILTQLEEEALRLEDTGMNRNIEAVRLRQMRDGEPDADEIAEVRGAGFEDVRRKLTAKLRSILRHGREEGDHFRRPMWLPQGGIAFRWRGGRLDGRSYRTWRRVMNDYLRQGDEEADGSKSWR